MPNSQLMPQVFMFFIWVNCLFLGEKERVGFWFTFVFGAHEPKNSKKIELYTCNFGKNLFFIMR